MFALYDPAWLLFDCNIFSVICNMFVTTVYISISHTFMCDMGLFVNRKCYI